VDHNRIALLVAILEKKMGLQMTGHDIFVNVAGGVRIDEPAADLGAIVAVASSFLDRPVDPATLILGEVGLAGEVRAVGQVETRVRQGAKLGFKRCVIPEGSRRQMSEIGGVEVRGVQSLREAWDILL
jgi:DNA repair protein RadA/Sms